MSQCSESEEVQVAPCDDLTVHVARVFFAPKMLRNWADYVAPGKFIPPVYAELTDGTIAVATNLYDASGGEVDDVRFMDKAVFCLGPDRWLCVDVQPSTLETVAIN